MTPVRVVASVSLLVLIVVTGCTLGGGASGAREDAGPETRLTILAVNPDVGRAVFKLSCGPAGGDLPDPAQACRALEESPELVMHPVPFTCAGGTFSWWELTVSGRLGGKAVHSTTATCWTPQMHLIDRLGIAQSLQEHVLPRRREQLFGGQRRRIPSGVLRPADLVVCEIRGRRLEQGVPIEPELGAQVGYDGVGVTSVALTVTRHRDGSVTAACGLNSPS